MRVLRTINNNVVICLDNNENEVVAFGKGIGFKKKNNDIIELSKIDRTYYKVKTEYVDMIAHISQDILDVSIKIIDYCRSHLKKTINPNVIFTLADHINFAIKRYEENIDISLPIFKDVEHLYENEYAVGLFGLHTINKMLSVSLPEVEGREERARAPYHCRLRPGEGHRQHYFPEGWLLHQGPGRSE